MADTTTARPAREAQSRLSPPAAAAAPVSPVTRVVAGVPGPSSTAPSPVRRSLRTQLILVVLAAALVPLVLLALWLARASGRAGETLLTRRLDAAVLSAANEAGVRWVAHRSALLDLAEAVEVRRALGDTAGGAVTSPAALPAAVRLAVVNMADPKDVRNNLGADVYISIEQLIGTKFADTFIGDASGSIFNGAGGNDDM